MSEIIKNSLKIIEQGFESLKTLREDKREYKEGRERVRALPDEYEYVYDKMSSYMWANSGGGDGYDMLAIQAGLLELFEASAAEGKQVLDVTGEDVAGFCDELLRNAKTYAENRREALNRDILKKLGKGDAAK